jgi:hypothetical protein
MYQPMSLNVATAFRGPCCGLCFIVCFFTVCKNSLTPGGDLSSKCRFPLISSDAVRTGIGEGDRFTKKDEPDPALRCLRWHLAVADFCVRFCRLLYLHVDCCYPQRGWADPGGTAIPGQPVEKSEQAPASSPSSKNQFNIDVPPWGTYQILS